MHTISNKWHQINKIITCIISSCHTFNMHLNVPICSYSGSDIEMKRLIPQRVQCLFSTPRFLFSHIIGWWWVEAQMQGMVGVPMMPRMGTSLFCLQTEARSPANDTGIHFLEGYCAHPSGSLGTLRELDVCQRLCCALKIEKRREWDRE